MSHETLTAIHFAFELGNCRGDDPDRRPGRLDRRAALGSFEVWQQAFESARPNLRWWRVLLYFAFFALWWDLLRRYRHRPQVRLRVKRIGASGLVLFTCVELTRL